MNSFFAKIPRALWVPAVIAAMVGGAVIGVKELGGLESLELGAYDQAIRWRATEPMDRRILVIGINEKDIGKYKYPIADDILHQALVKLTEREALVIGVDLVRDSATGDLLKMFQESDAVIPVCSHGSRGGQVLKSPPMPEGSEEAKEIFLAKVGFVDVPVDADGVTRRMSLFATSGDPTTGCAAQKSLAIQLAESYLIAKHNIEPQFDEKSGVYRLGQVSFPQLRANDGGYQKSEVAGYPLLLNYRGASGVVEIASLEDLLENRIANLKDRIVLIGATLTSSKVDDLRTPYSAGKAEDNVMWGVIVHAQATSQLISAALDGRSLIRFLPEWLENFLLLGVSVGGGYLAWFIRHPAKLAGAVGGAGAATVGSFGLAFANGIWMPVVSPVIGLIGTALATSAWRAYQTNQEQQQMLQLTRNQEQTIEALKQLLSQQPPTGFKPATGKTTSPFNPEDRPLLGERYQTTGILGSGGFATTYLAEDVNRPSRPRCAIKHLTPARHDPAFIEVSRRLFTTEAEILEKLGSHPQIPSLLAYFEQTEEFYLVQELIDGTPLDEELANRKEPWTQKKIVDLLMQMLPVLEYIHGQRVIHRDIKPSNIIRRKENGQFVLIDFGAVKEINPQNEKAHTISIGTRGYTPPEQFAGRPNFSSDIYALGMTAIEAATNQNPRDIEDVAGNLQWHHLAPIDPALIKIIDKMVVYESVGRYQSATEVLSDLQQMLQNNN